jgi:hypothetical protein
MMDKTNEDQDSIPKKSSTSMDRKILKALRKGWKAQEKWKASADRFNGLQYSEILSKYGNDGRRMIAAEEKRRRRTERIVEDILSHLNPEAD